MPHKQFKPRLDALPAAQQAFWPKLRPLLGANFVLHGGTAIALRLGHRISVDFNFFRAAPLARATLLQLLPWLDSATTVQDEPNTCTVLAEDDAIKLSLFGEITFGRLADSNVTSDGVALVASLSDLLAQKLKVVMQRVEVKDYQDVAALLRSGLSLDDGMAGASALFGPAFSVTECAKALVHFKGGDLAKLVPSDRQTLLQAVRSLPAAIPPRAIKAKSLA